MNFINKQRRLLVLSRWTNRVPDKQGSFDLLLSPQFYLMQKKGLDVRFAFEAKRLAPSILEELGAKDDWQFEVYREKEEWVFIAYNPEEILEKLRALDLNASQLHQIFFAQQIAEQIQTPLWINDKELLTVVDDVVVALSPNLLPAKIAKSSLPGIESISTPPKGFSFPVSGMGKWIGTRELMAIVVLMFLLASAWTVEGLYYKKKRRKLDDTLSLRGKDYPNLLNSITRTNIYQKFMNIDKRQRLIRDTIKRIENLTGKDSKIQSLKIDDRGYAAIIGTKPSKKREVINLAKRNGLPFKETKEGIHIQGAWAQ